MGSRMVNIPAIFAQHFDDIIHTPSQIKRSTFTTPKSSHWLCSRNHRCQGWVQIKPVSSRSELFFGVRIKKVIVISNTPRFQTEAWMILKRKSFNKNHRDQVLWFRETEKPHPKPCFFTKTAGRHNLVEVIVIFLLEIDYCGTVCRLQNYSLYCTAQYSSQEPEYGS